MIIRASLPGLRPLLILIGGWIMLESVVMMLISARIGWGSVLIFLSIKGGLGLLALVWLTLRAAREARRKITEQRLGDLVFPVLSGILIALPGLVPMLVGIALFSPSLREGVRSWWKRRAQPEPDPRLIELPDSEWQEIRTKKIRRRPKSAKPPLEGQPPSV